MKNIRNLFLVVALQVLFLSSGVAQSQVEIVIGALRGPTGVGIAPAVVAQPIIGPEARITVEVVGDPSIIVGRLAAGEIQVGMLPSNVAAQLYNRGVPVRIAAVTLWGLLYVVGDDSTVTQWSDLEQRTLQSIARGAGPDIMLRHILDYHGVDANTEMTLDYRYGQVELAQLMIAGTVSLGVLPEPFVTQVLSRNREMTVLLDFQEAWNGIYGERYPQTVVIVRADVWEKDPAAVEEALAVIEEGWKTVLADPEAAAETVDAAAIGLQGAVISQALPRFNAEYVPVEDAREALLSYFRILAAADPRSLGGAVPDEGIFLR